MFKHYLMTALRHFMRHKATTIVNVLCLSFGLASFIAVYGMNEYFESADLFHEKAQRTYVLTQRSEFAGTNAWGGTIPLSGMGIARYLKADYPDIEIVARAMHAPEDVAVATSSKKDFVPVAYADAAFLDIFDLPFRAGDRRAALRTPHSAVITEDLARKLFGNTDAMGKPLLLNNRETVNVTGIIGAPRQPSHLSIVSGPMSGMLQFSLLVSMDTWDALAAATTPIPSNQFFQPTGYTYVVLPKNGKLTVDQLRRDLTRFSDTHVPKEQGRAVFDLRPLPDIFKVLGDFLMKTEKTGIPNTVVTFIEGSLLLIIACLNYANLASAQATTRLKETAMLRVVGASRRQIIVQSFIEALLIVVIAMCLALAALPGMMNALQKALGIDISSVLFNAAHFWIWIAGVVVAVALLASAYPALVATRIRPAHALQSSRAPITKRRVMNALVVFQFATASFLFVESGVISAQNETMRRTGAHANSDPIVVIRNNLRDVGIDANALKDELRRHTQIKVATAINIAPGSLMGPMRMVRAQENPASRTWMLTAPIVDYDFFTTMGIKFLAGRTFDRTIASDVSTRDSGNVIIDRALAVQYGWEPQEAIGQSIYFPSSSAKGAPSFSKTVIGVVENEALYPVALLGSSATVYSLDPAAASSLLIRISKDNVTAGLSAIDATWNKLAANVPLRRSFVDEQYELVYRQLTGLTGMVRVLAWFSIFIGAMGLVGIATHAMAQRKFEIGVRRTVGASVYQLVTLLLKDFSKPVLIANAIAWPFAFMVALGYTSSFAQREAINALPYAASLLTGLAIAWLAVLRQAMSAARLNPATVLRHE